SALILARVDGGWEGSARRRALLSILNGPMDWTISAAVIALAAIARDDPEAEREISTQFRERIAAIPKQGYTCYAHALAWHTRRLPSTSEPDRVTLRRWINGLEGRDDRAPANSWISRLRRGLRGLIRRSKPSR